MFRRWDKDGNGALSWPEIDRAVKEQWPGFDHRPSLVRAYRAADVSADGWIERREFHLFLHYLVFFTGLRGTFDEIDSAHTGHKNEHHGHFRLSEPSVWDTVG